MVEVVRAGRKSRRSREGDSSRLPSRFATEWLGAATDHRRIRIELVSQVTGVSTENSESIEKSSDLSCPALSVTGMLAFIPELLSWLGGQFRGRAEFELEGALLEIFSRKE